MPVDAGFRTVPCQPLVWLVSGIIRVFQDANTGCVCFVVYVCNIERFAKRNCGAFVNAMQFAFEIANNPLFAVITNLNSD